MPAYTFYSLPGKLTASLYGFPMKRWDDHPQYKDFSLRRFRLSPQVRKSQYKDFRPWHISCNWLFAWSPRFHGCPMKRRTPQREGRNFMGTMDWWNELQMQMFCWGISSKMNLMLLYDLILMYMTWPRSHLSISISCPKEGETPFLIEKKGTPTPPFERDHLSVLSCVEVWVFDPNGPIFVLLTGGSNNANLW